SFGANDMRDGVSINPEKRKEPLILETEFLRTPNLMAYLSLPGEFPISKLEFKPTNIESRVPDFIPRIFDPNEQMLTNTIKNEPLKKPKGKIQSIKKEDLELETC
ncbi:MAG: type IV secretion system DNA-binding domain-containing protein, partial [Gammaproteobacteria bacterium]